MTGKFPIALAILASLATSMTSCTPSSAEQAGQNAPSTAAPGLKRAKPVPAAPGEDRCSSNDPDFLCLGIRYVAFKDDSGKPTVTEKQALQTIRETNALWAQCKIGFQIDEYSAVQSAGHGIRHRIGNYAELDDVRSAFADKRELLVAITGKWDRMGSLGDTGANAWTAMPGGPPYGAVLEQSVGTFSNIVAHELGHYLNLYHSNDSTELMNPTIYTRSKTITPQQCAVARKTASSSWAGMLR
jgi:hypothetical protein